jgi:tetratricopeptide (TPR) repeat protein
MMQAAETASTYLAHGNAYRERARGRSDTACQLAALDAYRAALRVDPLSLEAHINMGDVLRELGQSEAAVAAYSQALAVLPNMALAHLKLVQAKRMTLADPAFAHLMALVDQLDKLPSEQQMYLHFAAGKALDDIGLADDAFAHFAKGNALKQKTLPQNEAAFLKVFDRIKTVFTPELFERCREAGDPSARPIFVVGMPRSGTTLVEQILAAHPNVAGRGELLHFGQAVDQLSRQLRRPGGYPEIVRELQGPAFAKLGADYIARIDPDIASDLRVTDKLPSNFLFLGLIKLALPNAKIVHVSRDPRDTCLSCFFHLFDGISNRIYDLGELGRYYRAYASLMEHWRSVLGEGSFLDVRYEDVIAEPEANARKLLEHCGLDWDARVLSFHKATRAVRSASAAQVRQPLYASSVGRWRVYEKHLTSLFAALGDAI